jgi:hypothetical protein
MDYKPNGCGSSWWPVDLAADTEVDVTGVE